jgi:hypothetical protein
MRGRVERPRGYYPSTVFKTAAVANRLALPWKWRRAVGLEPHALARTQRLATAPDRPIGLLSLFGTAGRIRTLTSSLKRRVCCR